MITEAIIYVADKILGKVINETWKEKIQSSIISRKTYEEELIKVIYSTIDQFEIKYPYNNSEHKFPFYHSQVLFEKLTSLDLFNIGTEEEIINEFYNTFQENQNIIIPSSKEISEFYKLFGENIEQNKTIRQLFINENYKNQIFNNTGLLENIDRLLKQFIEKVDNNSSNYLPKRLTNEIPILMKRDIVGRGKILEELYEMVFNNEPVVVVNGLGGVGKTTIAQVFIGEYQTKYKHIIWITQIEGNDIYTQFASDNVLRKNLQIDDNIKEPKDVFNEIIRKLNQINDSPNLLVIDNVDNSVEDIRNSLPESEKWHTLMTSRINLKGFTLKPLDFLSKEEAYQLFISNYKKEDFSEAQIYKIIECVDCHTLSIELLSKTANQIEYNFEELLGALKEDIEINLDDVRHSDENKLEKINKYLSKIFKLSKLNEEELLILKRLSVLPYNYIEYATIKDLIVNDSSYKKLQLVLDTLYKKGWLLKDEKNNSFKMHVIIAEVVKNQANIKFEDIINYIELITDKLRTDWTKDNPVDMFKWVDYGKAILQYIASLSPPQTEHKKAVAQLQNNLALRLQDLGDYQGAKELLEKAKKSAEENFGENHPTTAISYSNLALVLQDLGDYQGAKELLEKAKKSDEENFGENHPTTAVSYSNLALVLQDLGDYQGAKELLEKAKISAEENFGENHPTTAVRYSNLATVLKDLGDYQGAKELLEKAKKSDEENFGENHPNTAVRYSNLALVLQELGDYQRAKELLEKAKISAEENFGENHPNTAVRYSNLALVLKALKDYQGAKKLLEKAVAIFTENLGSEHPNTKIVKGNLEFLINEMK